MTDQVGFTAPNYHLLNAMYSWITENNGRPFIVVPLEYVPKNIHHLGRDGAITLNISMTACGNLNISPETVSFNARFSGVKVNVEIPTIKVMLIFIAVAPQDMSMQMPQWIEVDAPEQPAEKPKRPTLSVVK